MTTTAAKKSDPEPTDALADLPVELLDRWSVSPGAWGASTDASEAYRAWREAHPDLG